MKIIKWISENILFLITIFLLVFIPLYPKIPLIDVNNTWVYIRLEDFFVAGAVFIWFIQLFRKKASIKTPITVAIIVFWLIGFISTLYAINFIFPHLINVFPKVAFFNYLRRIEYLSLFFIAYSSLKDRRLIPYIVSALSITMILIVFYGIGQRAWGFPAFLTMNEEFAKGIPLKLSSYSRIPSTFAGHYDLAAYLVLMIPIIGSLVFGFKNKLIKIGLIITGTSGLILLLMTASRVSFMVYLVAIAFMLILQKKKKLIIPVFIVSIILLNSFQGISQRFGSTISQVDVVVDARTGKPIGIAKQIPKKKESKLLVIEDELSTGENLPQGTGFIIPSGPTYETVTKIQYKRLKLKAGIESTEITNVEGNFVVKRALAYDMSFTTRFQGEWPRAIEALKRNILLGSGYSSISLATDNNYLRILGEVGFLGLASFSLIFLILGIYIRKILPDITDAASKSLVIGFSAGLLGLALNAILIDVFEASKVAFVLWLLIGIIFGTLKFYKKTSFNIFQELKSALLSSPAIIIYILIGAFAVFSMMVNNYFIGDDFTWLRWAADCKIVNYKSGLVGCEPVRTTIINYFTSADGFFYRPGTKVYFFLMYALFNFNNVSYHIFSIFMQFLNTSFVFLIAQSLSKNKRISAVTALLFLVLSAHFESVFWIASTGHLIASASVLASLYFYILWRKQKNVIFLFLSFLGVLIAPLFHEFGITAPILIFAYDLITREKKNLWEKLSYILFFASIPAYLYLRNIAKSHWFNGDYSYNLANLPYNVVGNAFGYLGMIFFGSRSIQYYQSLRQIFKSNFALEVTGLLIFIIFSFVAYKFIFRKLNTSDKKIILISIAIFVIGLLPFLGLGNISIRYVYLPSFGIILLLSFLLDKLYITLNKFNKIFSLGLFLLLIFSFSIFNLLEINRVNSHWKKAGQITSNLVLTFNTTFSKTGAATGNPVFYFANVPIKFGDAWVFPVGLQDAVWFNFQTENLTVHTSKNIDMALDAAEGSSSARVFEFDKNGDIEEVVRTKKTFLVPVR